MLEFTCPTCGKRMQGEDSSAGQPVQCAACHGMSIASGDAGKGPPSENSFREGEPPYQYDSPLPAVREEAQPILMRVCAGGILSGLKFAAIGFGLVFLPAAAFGLFVYWQEGAGLGMGIC